MKTLLIWKNFSFPQNVFNSDQNIPLFRIFHFGLKMIGLSIVKSVNKFKGVLHDHEDQKAECNNYNLVQMQDGIAVMINKKQYKTNVLEKDSHFVR